MIPAHFCSNSLSTIVSDLMNKVCSDICSEMIMNKLFIRLKFIIVCYHELDQSITALPYFLCNHLQSLL